MGFFLPSAVYQMDERISQRGWCSMKDLGYMFKFLQGNFSGHLHIVNVRVGVYARVAMLYSLYIVVAVSRFIHRSSTFSHEGSQKSESCNRNVRRVLVCTYVRTSSTKSKRQSFCYRNKKEKSELVTSLFFVKYSPLYPP